MLVLLLLLMLSSIACCAASKRGLVHIVTKDSGKDDHTWLTEPTSLSWYYNYDWRPTSAISETAFATKLEFIPMLWGIPGENDDFLAQVRSIINDEKVDVKCVLGFNEPDMGKNFGGSNIKAYYAAELWKKHMEPLKDDGLRLGAPGVASTTEGKAWLKEFFAKCKNCTVDFIPLHWYGNFEGFASYIGEMRATYPDKKLWVTEFGFAHQNLKETQGFFNTSIEYLDRLEYVERYSWFGSFRSGVSNVGPNGAMLDNNGDLTDLGAWYLGRKPSGKNPNSSCTQLGFGWWALGMGLGVTLARSLW